jgi:hypothetical protein
VRGFGNGQKKLKQREMNKNRTLQARKKHFQKNQLICKSTLLNFILKSLNLLDNIHTVHLRNTKVL